jgi:hypothetical protein
MTSWKARVALKLVKVIQKTLKTKFSVSKHIFCQDRVFQWFWITLPKSHFIDFFLPNAVWPKHHLTEHRLTEHHLTERPFDWNTIWPNRRSTERRLTERSYDRFFFSENGDRMTESTFDKKVFWPKKKLRKRSFDL